MPRTSIDLRAPTGLDRATSRVAASRQQDRRAVRKGRLRNASVRFPVTKAPLALVVWLAALVGPSVDWTSQYARQEIRWRAFIIGLTEVGELKRCVTCRTEAYHFYGLREQRPIVGVAWKEPNGWTIAFGYMRSPMVPRR
jgi:hypothetical protein